MVENQIVIYFCITTFKIKKGDNVEVNACHADEKRKITLKQRNGLGVEGIFR